MALSYNAHLTEVCTSVAGWSHVEDLQRIFIPHCWINSGPVLKGYAVILKVWVAFLVLFFFILFGIMSKIRALQIECWETSTGDPTQ